jgi:hypothetical protein
MIDGKHVENPRRIERMESRQLPDGKLVKPTRPQRIKVEFDRTGERLHLTYRRREWATGAFRMLWLIGWTVGCVFLARTVINDPQLFHFMFAVPFWASWIFVFCQVLKSFTQSEEFTLNSDGASYIRSVIFPICTRTVPLVEIQQFNPCQKIRDSERGTLESGIEIRTLGQSLQFAFGLDIQERTWLWSELNDHLSELNRVTNVVPIDVAPAEDESIDTTPNERPDRIEALQPAYDPVAPPADCSWRRDDDFDSIVFRQRGKLNRQAVAGLLFINCFWNGGVGVFVLGLLGIGPPVPAGAMWWGFLVFLIPFEGIGLVMFASLVLAVLEPIRTATWRFDSGSILHGLTWFGIGRWWTYPVDSLVEIELRRAKVIQPSRNPLDLRNALRTIRAGNAAFEVGLVGTNATDVCSVSDLTEGEARWMADVLLRERWCSK